MIIVCPFCQQPVLDTANKYHIATDRSDDFYCSTYVDVRPGVRWCHYSRVSTQTFGPKYEAILPPFSLIWHSKPKCLHVRQFGVSPVEWRMHQSVLQKEDATFEDFVQAYYRFQKLRVFS